jgi:CubicO group peptidase (beta-lactamase class C family)
MKKLLCLAVLMSGLAARADEAPQRVFPGEQWEEATPASQGVDPQKLRGAVELLAPTVGTDGAGEVVIVRNGRMIWRGENIDKRHGVWSATKSFTSTVLGLLIEDGKCTLDTRLAEVLPQMKEHYPEVTLRHLTTMTSGYRAVGDTTDTSYKHGPSKTPFEPSLRPLFTPPGSQYAYWDSAMNVLGLALTKIAGEPLEDLFRRRIAEPIGMREWDWGDYATVDGVVVNGGSGNSSKHVFISAREMARFGLLFLNKGNWNGRQLISQKWVEEATRVHVPASLPWAQPESEIDGRGVYGFNWWANGFKADGERKFPGAPPGMFWASGHNNNKCFVIPEWSMVIVRLGLDGRAKDEVWNGFLTQVAAAVAEPESNEPAALPAESAPFFQPPRELAGDFGKYASPLECYDGRPVASTAQWPARRAEILKTWHDLMGPWPPLIEKPRLEYVEKTRRENFTQHRVTVETAPDWASNGYLLVPDGKGPFPAVLVVYYEPETSIGANDKQLRDFGYQLAKRGFVTLSIGSPPGSYYPTKATCRLQPLSFHAYVAANCHTALAGLPFVDGERIGVVGHSYGGKWAMFASCLYDKFACAAWSDGGIVFDETRGNVNYWEPWYLGFEPSRERKPGIPKEGNPRTGPYEKMIAEGRDLHELHALMAPRPFLVSGGAEDHRGRWQALNHAIRVNEFLGYKNRVAMTNRQGHSPTAESNEQLYRFMEHFLKPPSSGEIVSGK